MNSAFDKFLITAMDRFVWFIILMVMTHLVTEFTKINGYTRGDRGNLIPINESMFLNAIEVPQLTMYPNHNLDMFKEPSQADSAAPGDLSPNGEEKTFSLRPIIDSIFDIPLSALNAVNRLVQRLTGNYYTPPTGTFPEKSPLIEKKA